MVVGNVTQSYEIIYNDNSNRVDGMILPNNSGVSSAISYFYDAFDRVTKKITIVSGTNASANIQESFTYKANSSLVASQTVVINGGAATTYSYTYDAMGNILTVKKNGATVYTYCYNATNQLASVADAAAGYTYLYGYDSAGNIVAEYVFNYTTASAPLLGGMLGSAIDANVYTYSSADWQDKLTNYNGKSITYDAAGNPTKWRNASSITWDGRNLVTYNLGSSSVGVQNTYNSAGIRTKKYYFDTVNDKAYNVLAAFKNIA